MRHTLLISASILLGCLLIGVLIGRSSQGEAPAAQPATPGRYQIQSYDGTRALFIDTSTGEVWLGSPGQFAWSGNWVSVPTPVRKPK